MAMATLVKEVRFEAAHRLPHVPENHKCQRLHGHSFRIEIHVHGEVHPEKGWVMDYADIAAGFHPLWLQLDHHYLNDIPGLENPTSENIAQWIWQRLVLHLPQLQQIVVHETCMSRCLFIGHKETTTA